jgi:hypothetical protein
MNLVLNKLSDNDIQFLNRLNMLNIRIRCDFRPIGQYYIFYPLTCNAAFRVGWARAGAATICQSRPSIRTNTVKPAQLTPKACRKRSEMVVKDLRVSGWSTNLSENRPELRNPSQQSPMKRADPRRRCEGMGAVGSGGCEGSRGRSSVARTRT